MRMYAVRETTGCSYSGDNSVKKTEAVAVEVTWPEGFDPLKPANVDYGNNSGDWRLVEAKP